MDLLVVIIFIPETFLGVKCITFAEEDIKEHNPKWP